MTKGKTLRRFIESQAGDYGKALSEITAGKKRSHWMWYIFSQLTGLGHSSTSDYYGVSDIGEAGAYLHHPVLGARLITICKALLDLKTNDANAVFGYPDHMKLKSSMTLFASVKNADPVFELVLNKFFNGAKT